LATTSNTVLEDCVVELACNTAANTVSQHTNPKRCVQHSDSALKIVSNTAKGVFKVCF
jgi:hypothetical protein